MRLAPSSLGAENETRRVEKLVATHDKEMQLINEKREAAVDEKKVRASEASKPCDRRVQSSVPKLHSLLATATTELNLLSTFV